MFELLYEKKNDKSVRKMILLYIVHTKFRLYILTQHTLSKQISLSADDGTPSSSSSSLTLFNATISNVSRFFPLKTVPYVPKMGR